MSAVADELLRESARLYAVIVGLFAAGAFAFVALLAAAFGISDVTFFAIFGGLGAGAAVLARFIWRRRIWAMAGALVMIGIVLHEIRYDPMYLGLLLTIATLVGAGATALHLWALRTA